MGLLNNISEFKFYDASTWEFTDLVIWIIVNIIALEIANYSLKGLDYFPIKKIPIQGPHLDTLVPKDYLFLVLNKSTTPIFIYYLIKLCWFSNTVSWSTDPLFILINNIICVPVLFVVYDFFYTIFHRGLHHHSIYRFIHKHHHRQNAPTRGYDDAINTHPLEYLPGQFNHIFSIWILGLVFPVHLSAVAIFMFLGMVMAGLNHTRLDVGFPGVYEVKHHDAHHRFPNSNYGQYVVFWDRLTGSYKESRNAPGKLSLENSNYTGAPTTSPLSSPQPKPIKTNKNGPKTNKNVPKNRRK